MLPTILPGSAPSDRGLHEQLLVQTLEQAVDAVVVIDEHNRVVLFNAAAEALWGWPRAEVLGRNVSMLVPPGIREAHDGYVNTNRITGINRIVGTSRDVPVERRNGTRLWASMSISRVVIGTRVLYTAFLKDVTAQRAQQQHLRQLSLVADRSGSGMVVADADRRITYVNAGFTRLLGFAGAHALGRRLPELARGPHTDAGAIDALRACAEAGQEMQTQLLLYTSDGRPLWASVMMNPVRGPAGELEHIVFVLTDITHTKMHEVLQHKVLDAMAHNAPLHDVAMLLCREVERIAPEVTATLLEVDADGCLRVLAAPSMPSEIEALTNGVPIGPEVGCCGTAAATGRPALSADIAADPRWAPVQRAFTRHGLRACWSNPIKARDGTVLGTLAFYYREPRGPDALHERLVDMGLHLCALLLERERERAHIHQLAYYDALTGLANRSMLRTQAERRLHEARRSGAPLALLFIDLDRFKQVNDTQGHPAGDALLSAVAARLQDSARAGDVAARMGGDEFVLVLPQCGASQAAAAAERLLAAVAQPVEAEGAVLYPGASLGIAMYPEDGADADNLLRCADMAMYQAKSAGGQCYRFYSAEMNDQAQERSRLESDLRAALRSGGLALHYQPQMRGQALHGVEALLRWTHPQHGPIPPPRVVETAGECGLLDALTQWVLQEACRQMADWRRRGVAVPRVSVNLDAGSFLDPALPDLLAGTLAAHGLQPADLAVEITEAVMLTPDPAVLATARAVRERGIALSLDDFGTGYSSLGALHRLPIGEIKLDGSFVQDIETSATVRSLACAVLHIARGLELSVVAEGVETEAQRSFLAEHGCPLHQGYLYARPLPPQALEAWLADKSPFHSIPSEAR
ncbi:MAG TPA: EAL domain-containing protein [Alicycliphilus denitrificans]|nr:EAL domain-containing protein [Alicycliphilus denitrificans]